MKKPINMVSIITPVFNAEQFIQKTIESVLDQTYIDWELIIVNDGSTDTTQLLIEALVKKDNRIKLINHKVSLGAGEARNTGIKSTNGTYIAFIDADDVWKPHKLETQLKFMKAHNISVCFSSYELIDEQGTPLNKIIEALPSLNYNKQLKCNYIGNLTGIYDVNKLGKLDIPKIKKRQDWVMWLKAIEKGGDAKGIKESLAYYRLRKESISANKYGLIKHNFNVYRKALGFSFIKSVFYLIKFLYEYFFIKSKQIKTKKP